MGTGITRGRQWTIRRGLLRVNPHVIRGGSWNLIAGFCRSALRFRGRPGYRFFDLGLHALPSFGGQVGRAEPGHRPQRRRGTSRSRASSGGVSNRHAQCRRAADRATTGQQSRHWALPTPRIRSSSSAAIMRLRSAAARRPSLAERCNRCQPRSHPANRGHLLHGPRTAPLVEQVGCRLRRHKLRGRTMHLKVRFADLSLITAPRLCQRLPAGHLPVWPGGDGRERPGRHGPGSGHAVRAGAAETEPDGRGGRPNQGAVRNRSPAAGSSLKRDEGNAWLNRCNNLPRPP